MKPIVYKFSDPNAPIANGTRTSLIAILKACLVDGYGQAPANQPPPGGWEMQFSDSGLTKAVFRSLAPGATGHALRIDCVTSSYSYNANISGYEAMSDLDTGLIPMFAGSANANNFQISNSQDTTARPWLLVADDRFFTLWVWIYSTVSDFTTNFGYSPMLTFGDIIPWYPNDTHACLLAVSNYGGNGLISLNGPDVISSTSTANYLLNFSRDSQGVQSAYTQRLVRGGGPGAYSEPGAAGYGMPWAAGNPIIYSRQHVPDKATYSLRGWIPGLYYPCHPLAFGQLATVDPGDGKKFLSVHCGVMNSSTICNVFIDLGDWRA